ncbi:hypothetical protein K1719_038595 [Acacia pycnantha]|nr:hypothetical protein K1719_038595 [Acacia pycnantha]
MSCLKIVLIILLSAYLASSGYSTGVQPLSKIAIHRATFELHHNASIKAHPLLLGIKVGQRIQQGLHQDRPSISLKFLLINQRSDFSIALFFGGLSNPKLVAMSNTITFVNSKDPLYPRLSQGKA